MARRPRIVFFDLDETLVMNAMSGPTLIAQLVDTHLGNLDAAQRERFARALFETASENWDRMFEPGRTGESTMHDSFRHAIAAIEGDIALAEAMFGQFIQTSSRGTRLSANALDVLDALRERGIATGIITNGIDALQRAKIDLHRLGERVDAVVISEHARAHKPDRKVFEHALRVAGHGPDDAWHVGDHLVNDVAGARGAGMTAVFYNPPKPGEKARDAAEHDAHHEIADLLELLRLID